MMHDANQSDKKPPAPSICGSTALATLGCLGPYDAILGWNQYLELSLNGNGSIHMPGEEDAITSKPPRS